MIIRFLASTDSNDKSLTHPALRAPLPKSREGKGASLILF